MERLKAIQPRSFAEAMHTELVQPSEEQLKQPIVEGEISRGAGALVNLFNTPSPRNAAEPHIFERIFKTVFEKSLIKSLGKSHEYMKHLVMWQLHALKLEHRKLHDAGSEPFNHMTMHEYVWKVMKTAHLAPLTRPVSEEGASDTGKKIVLRDVIVQHMMCEMQKFSLNPTGRKSRTTDEQ